MLEQIVLKEYKDTASKTTVRLVIGFDNEVAGYHAVDVRQDGNLTSQVFGPSLAQYNVASDEFKKTVTKYL